MPAFLRMIPQVIFRLQAFLRGWGSSSITARLNEIYSKESSTLEPALYWAKFQSLGDEDEDW